MRSSSIHHIPTPAPPLNGSTTNLQDEARLLLLLLLLHKSAAGGVFEHFAHAFVRLGRALEVFLRPDDLPYGFTLGFRNRLLRSFLELLNCLRIVSQILLAPDENNGKTIAEVKNLGDPLLLNVLQRIRRVDSKADEDDVRVGIGKGTKTIVIFLTSRIPKSKLDMLSVDLYIRDIVFKDSGHVNLRESSLRENNEQAGLAAGTVTNNNKLASDLSHFDETLSVNQGRWYKYEGRRPASEERAFGLEGRRRVSIKGRESRTDNG